MDPTNNPSLSIRPTRREIRQQQLKDLEKPDHVIITHLGEVITKPEELKEVDSKDA